MVWCKHCAEDHPTIRDHDNGYVCCTGCGRVIEHDIYVNDCTFIKTAGGQSQLSGKFVRSVLSDYSASHERTLMKGRDEISDMVVSLCVSGGDSIINEAHAFYTIAVERNFTRGRRTPQVAASCLYIACRQNEKPYLLIDFSEYLQINVYVLGAVFLQLCKLLRLEEHPIVQKLVDPSLFIHRFTERLLGEKDLRVSNTAMKIIARMKRDWMQTGRKPSGLCGAALYVSALSHGLKYSKSDVVSIVHICEATLTKRLIEFENTESGSLTIDELIAKSDELEREIHSQPHLSLGTKASGITEVLCQHKSSGVPHFAHGLCRTCYDEFVEISGGLGGGSEPPAFQRAERQRMMKASSGENAEEKSDGMPFPIHSEQSEIQADSLKPGLSVSEEEPDASSKSEVYGKKGVSVSGNEGQPDNSVDPEQSQGQQESESFSDIDDAEVDGYLHNEEEKHMKKLLWEMLNKDYLEQEAAKEAAAAEAREAYAANFANCSEDVLAAQELAAAATANAAKLRKEKKQRKAQEAKNAKPPQSAAEAARNVLTKKRLSSKINFDVLEKLFDSPTDEEKTKKPRVESDLGKGADSPDKHKQGEPDTVENDYYGPESGYVEDYDAEGEYGDYYGYGNEEGYGYEQGLDVEY